MKKVKMVKVLLVLLAAVLANMYWGCIHNYPKDQMSTADQIRLKQIEENQKSLLQQQQSEQSQKQIEELQKQIEELKKK